MEFLILLGCIIFFIGPWLAVAYGFYKAETATDEGWNDARRAARARWGRFEPHEAPGQSGWGEG